jgi:hypothetical protein
LNEGEDYLKSGLIKYISENFEVYPEQYGVYSCDGIDNRVRIDYLCKAKKHLIDIGFPSDYFGIEVKYFGPNAGLKKINETVGQCQIYRNSKFLKNNKQPFAVFLFSDIFIISRSYDESLKCSFFNTSTPDYIKIILRYTKLFNIGRIELGGGKFDLKLGDENFFRSYKSKQNKSITYNKSRNNLLGTIRQSGNVNKLNKWN